MAEMRKSKIRKSVVRKLNTAKFETLDVIVEQEHEIEWSDMKMLMEKTAGVTKLVIRDYQETEAKVLADLNLASVNGFPADGLAKRPISDDDKKGYDRL